MAGIELGGTLKASKGERAKVQSELAKLEMAITVMEELSGTSNVTSNGRGPKLNCLRLEGVVLGT